LLLATLLFNLLTLLVFKLRSLLLRFLTLLELLLLSLKFLVTSLVLFGGQCTNPRRVWKRFFPTHAVI
jgi:hypothetical protein